jgi:hypothetical protein
MRNMSMCNALAKTRIPGRLLAVCSQGAALQWGRQLRSGQIKWQTRGDGWAPLQHRRC